MDVVIARRGSLRSFSSPGTCATEAEAVSACWDLGRRIIDRGKADCSVSDLAND